MHMNHVCSVLWRFGSDIVRAFIHEIYPGLLDSRILQSMQSSPLGYISVGTLEPDNTDVDSLADKGRQYF